MKDEMSLRGSIATELLYSHLASWEASRTDAI